MQTQCHHRRPNYRSHHGHHRKIDQHHQYHHQLNQYSHPVVKSTLFHPITVNEMIEFYN